MARLGVSRDLNEATHRDTHINIDPIRLVVPEKVDIGAHHQEIREGLGGMASWLSSGINTVKGWFSGSGESASVPTPAETPEVGAATRQESLKETKIDHTALEEAMSKILDLSNVADDYRSQKGKVVYGYASLLMQEGVDADEAVRLVWGMVQGSSGLVEKNVAYHYGLDRAGIFQSAAPAILLSAEFMFEVLVATSVAESIRIYAKETGLSQELDAKLAALVQKGHDAFTSAGINDADILSTPMPETQETILETPIQERSAHIEGLDQTDTADLKKPSGFGEGHKPLHANTESFPADQKYDMSILALGNKDAERFGIDAEKFQQHHIISDKHKLTENHPLWGLAGVSPQSATNKIFLPTKEEHHPTRSVHDGRHLAIVNEKLSDRMNEAIKKGEIQGWTQDQYRQALNEILTEERSALKSGERKLNKHHREWAKEQIRDK